MDPISTPNLGIPSAWTFGDVLDTWNPSVLDSLPETFLQGPPNLTETWDLAPDFGYGPGPIPTFHDPSSTVGPFDASNLFNDIDISQIHIPDEWAFGDLTMSESHDPETRSKPL